MSENVNNNSISNEVNNNSLAELKYQQRLIELRRARVSELWAQGWSQQRIAEEVHVDQSSISLDIKWLKEQAREQIKLFVTEKLPVTVSKAFVSLDLITTKLWSTVAQAERDGDEKIKMQALSQIQSAESAKIDLVSNLGIVDSVVGAAEQRGQKEHSAILNGGTAEPEEELENNDTSDDKSTANLVCNQQEELTPATRARAIPLDGEDN